MNRIREIKSALIQVLYWAIRIAAFPLLVFYFLYRAARDPRYSRRFSERLGAEPALHPTPPGAIWLHAVSVGEVVSAAELLREIRQRSPSIPLYVSVTTVAGRAIAEERLSALVDGIFYAPLDYAFAVRRVLARIRPSAVVILETEIWPVLYREAKRAGCSLLIVNGRISDRAFPRYRRLRFFFEDALRRPDAILVQSDQDAARYLELGASSKAVAAIGNLKYDAEPSRAEPPRFVTEVIAKLHPSAVWIAASTMAGVDRADVDEDDAVLSAYQELTTTHPELLLILVPRKPERFDQAEASFAARACATFGGRRNPSSPICVAVRAAARFHRRTGQPVSHCRCGVHGRHARAARWPQCLEPAACRKAIVTGPHLENFAAIAAEFRERRAFLKSVVPVNWRALSRAWSTIGRRGKTWAHVHSGGAGSGKRGVAQKAVAEILRWQDLAIPCSNQLSPARFLLWPLAFVWGRVSELQQRRKIAHARRLATPVVSVGGISMGGAGKTPMVDYLAERLSDAVIILRFSRADIAAAPSKPQFWWRPENPRRSASPEMRRKSSFNRATRTQVLAPTVLSPGVCSKKDTGRIYSCWTMVSSTPGCGAIWIWWCSMPESLRRRGSFSAGKFARASWLRFASGRFCDHARRARAGVRRHCAANPGAQSACAHLSRASGASLLGDYRTRQPAASPGAQLDAPVAAFCGLANPANFWGTLRSLRLPPVFHWAFDDHHHCSCAQVERLAAQAKMHGSSVLLTTEKDAMNLPDSTVSILDHAGIEVYWLKIGVHLEKEDQLLELIAKASK